MAAPKIQILPLRRAEPRRTSRSQTPHSGDSAHSPPLTKRPRASKPKVRTGCLTCKIRRIKCDEIKPCCSRCTSTGRKCDGYSIPPRKGKSNANLADVAVIAPERCPEVVPGTAEELRALNFFHARTAPGLSSYFDADFWLRLCFRMSKSEPAIRHAMVAVGTLHERRDLEFSPTYGSMAIPVQDRMRRMTLVTKRPSEHNNAFALAQYNKAIAHLTERMRDPEASTEIALLTCILFVCVEFIRGDVQPAIRHFNAGMNIAAATLSRPRSTATASVLGFREALLPFFNRLEILTATFGNDAQWEYPVKPQDTVPAVFASITEARNSIVHLMNHSLRFIRAMRFHVYEDKIPPEHIAHQRALQCQVETWQARFDTLLVNNQLSARDLDAARILRVHQIVTLIWLTASVRPEQHPTDEQSAWFETAVSLGEAVRSQDVTLVQQHTTPTTFLFDMEIVSPMYYVAIKCRHPLIRRRAIALLRQSIRREGLWDSAWAATIAEYLMKTEEVHLTVLDGSELPAENLCIHNAQIQGSSGLHRKNYTVTFAQKPAGVHGPWKIWQEEFVPAAPSVVREEKDGLDNPVFYRPLWTNRA
ncbi:hypothetical protein LTR08_006932 [Meristemomyces frigidus]|nr:hypothetical protein LTR08_006932 [Meristemomyces frigidus]